MAFLPNLQNFLREHGIIYTVRGYDMSPSRVEVEGVGMCSRIPLGEVRELEDLESYVALSGFSSLRDWRARIATFTTPGQRVWLYKVEVS